jgi:hypothetical protein
MATETIIQKESPEVEAYKLNAMLQAKNLTAAPPTGGLPAIQAAGADPLQTQAQTLAQQGIGGYQPQLTAAQSAFTSGIGALSGATGMFDPRQQVGAFMNPYQQAVQSEIQRAFDMQRADLGQQAAQAGAFGGSRAAVQQAEIGRNEAAALAKAQADNYLQAQQAAQAAFEAQQGRALAGAEQLGQFGVQQAALGELGSKLGLQDVQTLSGLGATQREIDQAQLEAQRQTKMQDIYEPYQRLGFYSDILRGAPSTQQQITTSAAANPSLLNQLVGGAATGLGLYGAANKTGLI